MVSLLRYWTSNSQSKAIAHFLQQRGPVLPQMYPDYWVHIRPTAAVQRTQVFRRELS
jgi:hypothetical protein